MSVATVPLGDLMAAKKSSVDPRKTPNQEFELFSIPAFDSGRPEIVAGADIGSSKQIVMRGDVLLSRIVPHIRRAWVVEPRSGRPTIGSGEWIIFRNDRFEPAYLRHALVSDRFHQAFMRTVAGVGGSLLRARPSSVAEIEIALPSIEEQRRIAAVLDAADVLRATRRQTLAKLDNLTQAIFIDMFGDPATNPKGWPDCGVDGVLDFLTYGHRFYDDSYSESGTPLVRITDLNEAGDLNFVSMPRMSLTDQDRQKYRVRSGDLLFARSGATVGKVALIRDGDPECIAGAYFVWMRFVDAVNPEYARSALTSDRIRDLISKRSRQAAQQNFSGPAIRRLPMPVPTVALQDEFAAIATQVRVEKARHVRGLTEFDKLFAALQQRAFRGEL